MDSRILNTLVVPTIQRLIFQPFQTPYRLILFRVSRNLEPEPEPEERSSEKEEENKIEVVDFDENMEIVID